MSTDQTVIRMPSRRRVIGALASVTFREIVRDKVLYSVLVCAVFMMAVAYLASRLAYNQNVRIVLDFGLTVLNLCLAMTAILIGTPLLIREFERRTALLVLSKPITRGEFLLGKFFGLIAVLTLIGIGVGGVFLLVFFGVGGSLSGSLIWAWVLAVVQGWLMAALAFFFASFSTTSLAVMISVGLYLAGSNISQLRFVAAKTEVSLVRWILEGMTYVLPNLEYFQLGPSVTYGLPVGGTFVAIAWGYACVSIVLYLFFAGALLKKKEI